MTDAMITRMDVLRLAIDLEDRRYSAMERDLNDLDFRDREWTREDCVPTVDIILETARALMNFVNVEDGEDDLEEDF